MRLTPWQAYEEVKEAVVGYLEGRYRVVHPLVFGERAELLRRPGVVAGSPFVEATPAFPTGAMLADLEKECPAAAPPGITELVSHGIPLDRFPLYLHQEQALKAAVGGRPNLLIATGTGSGKTEAFLLPILADILREAPSWPAPADPEEPAGFDPGVGYRPRRRHERRPAAVRALILYPMNALVNDQLARLRRILVRNGSPDWQRARFRGNLIYFAMYTSLLKPTGRPDLNRWQKFNVYLDRVRDEWEALPEHLRASGMWPAPEGPELLCRWDIQDAPPDILITNYSMLEHMLLRPLEAPIFEATRRWLAETDGARFTLVVDEVHTYTGARGTETAYLIRRLKERLGLERGDPRFRAVASSASVDPADRERLQEFAAGLFDEPPTASPSSRSPSPRRGRPRRLSRPAWRPSEAFTKTSSPPTPSRPSGG